MTPDEIRTALQPWLRKHTRKVWFPILEDGQGDPQGSRFGGGAWIPDGAQAPHCGRCGETLRLLLQLNLATVPPAGRKGLPERGLLQVFYCEDDACELEEEGYLAFSPIHRVQVVPVAAGRLVESSEPFAPKAFAGWREAEETPHPEDIRPLGLDVEYDHPNRRIRYLCPEVGLDAWVSSGELPVESITQSAEGDKLAGWPFWIQSAEYPTCPKCQSRMTNNLFQIESEKGVPQMWGDAGIVQVLQCPKDADVLTMNWSCA